VQQSGRRKLAEGVGGSQRVDDHTLPVLLPLPLPLPPPPLLLCSCCARAAAAAAAAAAAMQSQRMPRPMYGGLFLLDSLYLYG